MNTLYTHNGRHYAVAYAFVQDHTAQWRWSPRGGWERRDHGLFKRWRKEKPPHWVTGYLGPAFTPDGKARTALTPSSGADFPQETTLAMECRALLGAVKRAAGWFREYEAAHTLKATPDGMDKAARNAERARYLENIVAALGKS